VIDVQRIEEHAHTLNLVAMADAAEDVTNVEVTELVDVVMAEVLSRVTPFSISKMGSVHSRVNSIWRVTSSFGPLNAVGTLIVAQDLGLLGAATLAMCAMWLDLESRHPNVELEGLCVGLPADPDDLWRIEDAAKLVLGAAKTMDALGEQVGVPTPQTLRLYEGRVLDMVNWALDPTPAWPRHMTDIGDPFIALSWDEDIDDNMQHVRECNTCADEFFSPGHRMDLLMPFINIDGLVKHLASALMGMRPSPPEPIVATVRPSKYSGVKASAAFAKPTESEE
jgi:hypothetical protein